MYPIIPAKGSVGASGDLAPISHDSGAYWRRQSDVRKRGMSKGKYMILRATFDKRYPPDVELYERIARLAKAKKMKLNEYCKLVLIEHAKKAQNSFLRNAHTKGT